MPKPKYHHPSTLFFNPWVTFFIFLTAGTFLSYFHFTLQEKIWIFSGGLIFPFLLALFAAPGSESKPVHSQESLPLISTWVVGGLLLAAFCVRFYKLTTFSVWPLQDEGEYGFYGMELSEKWNWAVSYDQWQKPHPLSLWLLGLLFKLTGPSLGSLWFLPAFLSALTVPVVYGCSRKFFSRSFSLILLSLWSFSFWPIYLGRLCLAHGLTLLWLPVTLTCFGFFMRATTKPPQEKWAVLTGLCLASGFYTTEFWIPIAALTGLAFLLAVRRKESHRPQLLLEFLLPQVLAFPVFSLYYATWKQKSYLFSAWSFQTGGFSWKDHFRFYWDYLGGLFWGVETDRYGYKPIWGGLLNSVETALFLTGLLELKREFHVSLNRWVLFSFVLFLLPGLLSNELEMLRVVLVLPLMLWICAVGANRLLLETPSSFRVSTGVSLMVFAGILGVYHLVGPYQNLWRSGDQISINNGKSPARYKAYQLLSSAMRQKGPGLVLTEFDSTPFDQTLPIAIYPFNASRNPKLDPQKATWAGVLTNIHYAPFLSSDFPSSLWFPLSKDVDASNNVLVLGLIPRNPDSERRIQHWVGFEKALRPITSKILHTPFKQSSPDVLADLLRMRPMVQGDPFLESCLDEKIFFSAMSNNRTDETIESLRRALTKGYPAAHLYNELGVFWFTRGNYANAREAFQAALRSPLNHTNALDNLQRTPLQ